MVAECAKTRGNVIDGRREVVQRHNEKSSVKEGRKEGVWQVC